MDAWIQSINFVLSTGPQITTFKKAEAKLRSAHLNSYVSKLKPCNTQNLCTYTKLTLISTIA